MDPSTSGRLESHADVRMVTRFLPRDEEQHREARQSDPTIESRSRTMVHTRLELGDPNLSSCSLRP